MTDASQYGVLFDLDGVMVDTEPLYSEAMASFTMGAEYDPADAGGFIRCFGLPMKVHAMVHGVAGGKAGKGGKEPREKKSRRK